MSRRNYFALRVLALLFLVAAFAIPTQAQGRYRTQSDDGRNGVPIWQTDQELPKDVFTFARVKYTSMGRGGRGRGRGGWGGYGGPWDTDYPDAELNLSWRLKEMTSLKVHPEGAIVELTDPKLFSYPFIYMIEPGGLFFYEEEVVALRKYLKSGGFMMVDDFWGEYEWDNFYQQIKRVFPDREPQDLAKDHPVFSAVFPLKEPPQIPSIGWAMQGRQHGVTWERPDAREPHYRVIYDDKGRIMVFICHNTDLGDGWEREGEDPWYFQEFSEKKAYPLGINILFYSMTH